MKCATRKYYAHELGETLVGYHIRALNVAMFQGEVWSSTTVIASEMILANVYDVTASAWIVAIGDICDMTVCVTADGQLEWTRGPWKRSVCMSSSAAAF